MVSVEGLRKDLGNESTDKQVIGLRDALYELVETLLDDYIENSWKIVESNGHKPKLDL